MWMASCVSAPYLGKRWHQDAVEEGKPAVAVWCSWQCSARKSWILTFMGMSLSHVPPTQTSMQTKYGNCISQWQWTPSAGQCALPKLFRNGLSNMTNSSKFWFVPLYAPDPIVGSAWNTSLIHGDPTFKITGLKGFAHFFPDTTGQPQRSYGVMRRHVRAVLAAQGDPHNIGFNVIADWCNFMHARGLKFWWENLCTHEAHVETISIKDDFFPHCRFQCRINLGFAQISV